MSGRREGWGIEQGEKWGISFEIYRIWDYNGTFMWATEPSLELSLPGDLTLAIEMIPVTVSGNGVPVVSIEEKSRGLITYHRRH